LYSVHIIIPTTEFMPCLSIFAHTVSEGLRLIAKFPRPWGEKPRATAFPRGIIIPPKWFPIPSPSCAEVITTRPNDTDHWRLIHRAESTADFQKRNPCALRDDTVCLVTRLQTTVRSARKPSAKTVYLNTRRRVARSWQLPCYHLMK